MALFPNNNYRYTPARPVMFPPVVRALLAVNVLLFLVGMVPLGETMTVHGVGGIRTVGDWLVAHGALFPLGTRLYAPWQYFTMMFLHGGLGHLLFNMLALWMFGNELEQLWGSKRFLLFYVLCGIGAGVLHNVVTMATGDGRMIPAVGASGAIMGLLVAFGMLFPDRMIMLGFFFPMRARIAVFVIAGIDLVLGITAVGDGIAHFAHLGGAAMGLLLLQFWGRKWAGLTRDRAARRSDPVPRPVTPLRTARTVDASYRDLGTPAPPPRQQVGRYEFGADQERIDAVLDKINRSGYQSLNDEEKALLTAASRKMGGG